MEIQELETKTQALRGEVKSIFDSNREKQMTQSELDEVERKMQEIRDLEAQIAEVKASVIVRPELPLQEKDKKMDNKTLGQQFIESGKQTGNYQFKATFLRTDGLAPERPRDGYVDHALREPLGLLDVMNIVPVKGDGTTFLKETVTTGPDWEEENGAYHEGDISYASTYIGAAKVTHIIPVTDEALDDNENLESLLDDRMTMLLKEKFENGLVAGTGTTSPVGFLNLTNKLTYVGYATECYGDAIIRGASAIREAKAGEANLVIMNPADFTKLRLLKDTTKNYLYAGLMDGVNPTIDGMPIVKNSGVTAGSVVVLDKRHFDVGLREDANIEVGYNGTDFSYGRKSIRGTMRGSLIARRDQACCIVNIASCGIGTV